MTHRPDPSRAPSGDLRNEVAWPESSFDQPLETSPPVPRETISVDFFSPAAEGTPGPTAPTTSPRTPSPSPSGPGALASGVLELRVAPASSEVTVGGAAWSPASGRLLLAPGRYRVRAKAPGYDAADLDVDVQPGRTSEARVTLSPSASGSAGEASKGPVTKPWAWALALAGAAVIVVGGTAALARRRGRASPERTRGW